MLPAERAAIFNARAAFACIGHIEKAFVDGNEAGAREALSQLAVVVTPAIPVLDAILAAHFETAQARDLTELTLSRFFPRVAEPQPDAANDHVSPPEQPTPSVA